MTNIFFTMFRYLLISLVLIHLSYYFFFVKDYILSMMKQVTVGNFSPVSVADLASPPSPRPPTIVPEKSLVRRK